jgi:hypothetical protein
MEMSLDCPVCYEAFDTEDFVPNVICGGGHTICKSCSLRVAQKGSCPICRAIVLPTGGVLNRFAVMLIENRSGHSFEKAKYNVAQSRLQPSVLSAPPPPSIVAPTADSENTISIGPQGTFHRFTGLFNELSAFGDVIKWVACLEIKVVPADELEERRGRVMKKVNRSLDAIYGAPLAQIEDEGNGDVHVIGQITWTDATIKGADPKVQLRSGHELVLGSYSTEERLLRLRGVDIAMKDVRSRHGTILTRCTGYRFHMSRNGHFLRGYCRCDSEGGFGGEIIQLCSFDSGIDEFF